MKNRYVFFFFFLVLLPLVAFAEEIIAPPGLEWLTPQLIAFLKRLPGLGEWVVIAFQYVGFVAALFTALTTFVAVVIQLARGFAWVIGLQKLADDLNALHKKVMPYLAYLSIFNAPKPGKN